VCSSDLSDGVSTGAAGAPDAVTTTRFRLPAPADAARGSDAARPTSDEVSAKAGATPAGTADTAEPSEAKIGRAGTRPEPASVSPSLDPVPAPAVPAPGPAAAPPPPWRRVPGQDVNRSEPDTMMTGSPADRLLDDGPTAFLETPRYGPQTAGSASGEPGVSDSAGWVRAGRSRPPRQAALQLKRLDPWSVLKLALVLAVVLFFIWLVAVGVLYGVLDGMGVWDRLNGTYADLVSGEAQSGNSLISAGRVFGLAAVVGAINSLLFAVAVTVGAFVYNVSADLVGGIEVTLSERD